MDDENETSQVKQHKNQKLIEELVALKQEIMNLKRIQNDHLGNASLLQQFQSAERPSLTAKQSSRQNTFNEYEIENQ